MIYKFIFYLNKLTSNLVTFCKLSPKNSSSIDIATFFEDVESYGYTAVDSKMYD